MTTCLRQLILALVLLTGTAFTQPANAPQVHGFETTSDCSLSRVANTTNQMVIHCQIVPTDDGYADNLLPSQSFGGSGVLIVQNVPSVPVSKTNAFLKFDMQTSLPLGLVESGAKPENATLEMYVRLMNFFYNATVEVHNASPQNWTENTLSWNSMPAVDANNYVSLNIRRNGTWARWDITHLIQPAFNSSGQVAFAAISSETDWKNLVWFDSKEYQFSNGTTSPTLELTFVEPYLTIETPYANIPISVGSSTFATDSEGKLQLMLPWGKYIVTVPDTIAIANGTRARFVDWSDRINSSSRLLSVGNNITIRATYGIQHELTVYSPFATVTGGGWYFQNADATVSINPTSVPAEGLAGWLGARYIFDHWTGACTATAPQCNILMNSPEHADAVWRVDWSLTVFAACVLITSAALAIFLRKRHSADVIAKPSKKRRRRSYSLRLHSHTGESFTIAHDSAEGTLA